MITTQYLKFDDRAEEIAYLKELSTILTVGILQGDPLGNLHIALERVNGRIAHMTTNGTAKFEASPVLPLNCS